MVSANEQLVSLSDAELSALADGVLAPSAQGRLDELLRMNADGKLTTAELAELDLLLARIDQLNIVKTRARLTLRQATSATRHH